MSNNRHGQLVILDNRIGEARQRNIESFKLLAEKYPKIQVPNKMRKESRQKITTGIAVPIDLITKSPRAEVLSLEKFDHHVRVINHPSRLSYRKKKQFILRPSFYIANGIEDQFPYDACCTECYWRDDDLAYDSQGKPYCRIHYSKIGTVTCIECTRNTALTSLEPCIECREQGQEKPDTHVFYQHDDESPQALAEYKDAEMYVEEMLRRLKPDTFGSLEHTDDIEDQYSEIDARSTNVSVEIKSDYKSIDTNNIFLEGESDQIIGSDGWILNCKADCLVFYLPPVYES